MVLINMAGWIDGEGDFEMIGQKGLCIIERYRRALRCSERVENVAVSLYMHLKNIYSIYKPCTYTMKSTQCSIKLVMLSTLRN